MYKRTMSSLYHIEGKERDSNQKYSINRSNTFTNILRSKGITYPYNTNGMRKSTSDDNINQYNNGNNMSSGKKQIKLTLDSRYVHSTISKRKVNIHNKENGHTVDSVRHTSPDKDSQEFHTPMHCNKTTGDNRSREDKLKAIDTLRKELGVDLISITGQKNNNTRQVEKMESLLKSNNLNRIIRTAPKSAESLTTDDAYDINSQLKTVLKTLNAQASGRVNIDTIHSISLEIERIANTSASRPSNRSTVCSLANKEQHELDNKLHVELKKLVQSVAYLFDKVGLPRTSTTFRSLTTIDEI